MSDIYITKIYDFIRSIGIEIEEISIEDSCILPGIKLGSNKIYIDRTKLSYPGDILHDLGHLAVLEAQNRQHFIEFSKNENWATDGDEIAVILWSYAAAIHIGLPLNVLFHKNGYKNDSEWLIEQFTNKTYIGLALLVWMGFCNEEEFPKMKKWLR